VDGLELSAWLDAPFANPRLEPERAFALGWLAWLAGDFPRAEEHLGRATELLAPVGSSGDSEWAYWRARVRLLLGRSGVLPSFEDDLRRRGGSPQATCWYVDLLWRAGQAERAEQVWKTVRGNRKVSTADLAPVLEARYLIRHGDLASAERALGEARPRGGVTQVERSLLLAWVLANRNQADRAGACLRQAESGPYPDMVLRTWRTLFDQRHGTAAPDTGSPYPAVDPALTSWLRGQEARLRGQDEEAAAAYRAALAHPRLRPFARYGLACLGQDNFAAIIANQPELFLAVRCRVRLLHAIWRRACELTCPGGVADWQAWQAQVTDLRSNLFLRPLALMLLVHGAVHQDDPAALAAVLQDAEGWKCFANNPPDSLFEAVAAVTARAGDNLPLARAVADWLRLWDTGQLGPQGRRLAVRSGVVAADPEADEPPPGIAAVPWFLHQAALAIGRQDPSQVLRWLHRALQTDPQLREAGPGADKVARALPELEWQAQAQALARAVALMPDQPPPAWAQLHDFVQLLREDPSGQAALSCAAQGDIAGAHESLEALARHNDLPPRLAHHLALVFHRAAFHGEAGGPAETADRCWHLAWRCWLRMLGSLPTPGKAERLAGRLLDSHRQAIREYLAQGVVDAARRHWGHVNAVVPLARELAPDLAGMLAGAVTRFRDDLTRDCLTALREVMKHGAIPEGWRADYAPGLAYLKRLLSLDRDNLRLLTALVETAGDWFLDCYNNEDPPTLWEQVERLTPFALKLARLVEERPEELAARAALAEFTKYRGFIAADLSEKVALYREAARFDPTNENVRQLLAEAEDT
jgi:hypothetical protein